MVDIVSGCNSVKSSINSLMMNCITIGSYMAQGSDPNQSKSIQILWNRKSVERERLLVNGKFWLMVKGNFWLMVKGEWLMVQDSCLMVKGEGFKMEMYINT